MYIVDKESSINCALKVIFVYIWYESTVLDDNESALIASLPYTVMNHMFNMAYWAWYQNESVLQKAYPWTFNKNASQIVICI